MFSHHNEIKLEFINRRITRKSPDIWKLNNTTLTYLWIKERAIREIGK